MNFLGKIKYSIDINTVIRRKEKKVVELNKKIRIANMSLNKINDLPKEQQLSDKLDDENNEYDLILSDAREQSKKIQNKSKQDAMKLIEKAGIVGKKIINKANKKSKEIIDKANKKSKEIIDKANNESKYHNQISFNSNENRNNLLIAENEKIEKLLEKSKKELQLNEIKLNSINIFCDRFPNVVDYQKLEKLMKQESVFKYYDESRMKNIIQLPIHCDNSKELKKLSNEINKKINKELKLYGENYTTKSNKTIYLLTATGLQSEIRTLLYTLKYENIDKTHHCLHEIITKYINISCDGNKSILPTMIKFLSEMEALYQDLINVEHKYYIHKQQEKEEQIKIKEIMRQDEIDKKILKDEKDKLEKEESKFKIEIDRNQEQLHNETDILKIKALEKNLMELKNQLNSVSDKKEEIVNLSTGKAGYVYIISNLGSFGEDVFKIGMTRRLDPQKRVDKLSSASVPFKFDVHSMIFSEDAVKLENLLHKKLSDSRVNKVNPRKEFFKLNISELEAIVENIDPTADFSKTMYAEEYNQTLSFN